MRGQTLWATLTPAGCTRIVSSMSWSQSLDLHVCPPSSLHDGDRILVHMMRCLQIKGQGAPTAAPLLVACSHLSSHLSCQKLTQQTDAQDVFDKCPARLDHQR